MSPADLLLRAAHVALPDGARAAMVRVRDGRIVAVLPPDHPDGRDALDLGRSWLLPGLVDTHVHINEPGRAEWEGFESATAAAASGGVTTLVDMPLNSIPATTTVAALEAKRLAARGRVAVDVGFWGGVVPGNDRELEPLAAAGVPGFKCFMAPSGVDEFRHVGAVDLARVAPILVRLGLPLLVHAEDPATLDTAAAGVTGRDPRRYATWLASRPPAAERAAVARLEPLLASGVRVHVVHVACGEVVQWARRWRARGAALTLETCPHYLIQDAGRIVDGATVWKCAPPIRDAAQREELWRALLAGDLDLVVSDHSPCTPDLKETGSGDFTRAWGGIASLELGLAVMWTEARERGATPAHLAGWMSAAPARLAGWEGIKGVIAPGADADLVAFDPDRTWTVDPAALRQRHPLTPYAGRALVGGVVKTWLAGVAVRDGDVIHGGRGRLLGSV
ncbi:MAG: allantoinase AllB [Candidatus Eisenbacteria bacterium]